MAADGTSSIKVPRRVAEAAAGLQRHIEKHGWGALAPELREFFQPGINRGAIVEAALFLLERELKCPDQRAKKAKSAT